MNTLWKYLKRNLSVWQTVAAMSFIGLALLGLGAASMEQLSVDYTTRACAQSVNFSGTFQVGGIAPASANTVSAIVKRDSSGNFAAGTITAALTGAASANPTISTGTAAPTTTPTKRGDLFVDYSAHKLYFADATTDSTGWVAAN